MFISNDKTIIDVNYKPDGVDGWVVDAALAVKIREHYPWFDFVVNDGELVDITSTEPQIMSNIPTAEERIAQLEADKAAIQQQLDELTILILQQGGALIG